MSQSACGALCLAVVMLGLPAKANDTPEHRFQDLRLVPAQSSGINADVARPGAASELMAQAPAAVPPESETDRRGFYLSASGMWQSRLRASEVNVANTFLNFDSGYALSAAAGYRLGDIRLEGEFTYFNNAIQQASATIPFELGLAPAAAQGDVGLYAFMANIYYDIPTNSRFRPYAGAGLGFYTSRINNLTATFFPVAMLNPVNQTSETSFAFQIKAGVSYEISPKSEAFVGYRYFDGSTLNFNDPGNLGQFSPNGARIHAAEIGFRYFF